MTHEKESDHNKHRDGCLEATQQMLDCPLTYKAWHICNQFLIKSKYSKTVMMLLMRPLDSTIYANPHLKKRGEEGNSLSASHICSTCYSTEMCNMFLKISALSLEEEVLSLELRWA